MAALSAAGRPTDRFLFCGFLPPRPSARQRALDSLRTLPFLLIFYEAPHRVRETLADLRDTLGGGRTVTIAREITKHFESFHTCTLAEAEPWVAADPNREKGEFVLLVDGAELEPDPDEAQADHVLRVLLADLPLSQAVTLAAAISRGSRNRLYARALQLKDDEVS
jgi:16S rRNA (cytidine1402-2'-O)-methyltransferase